MESNMAIEIERKFLINGDFRKDVTHSYRITQGYLCSQSGRTVRVRRRDNQGFLTIKGKSEDGGLSRFEWEKEINLDDAEQLMSLCGVVIDKVRHIVPFGGHIFEVDEFYGDNEGLIVAEIELKSPDEPFLKPGWLGEEVTGDKKYYNSKLAKNPYKYWEQ